MLDSGAEECNRKPGAAQMLRDPGGATARRYNAFWLPRAYALDERGVVTYVQSERTMDPQAPLQVAALWSRPSRSLAARNGNAGAPAPAVRRAGLPD